MLRLPASGHDLSGGRRDDAGRVARSPGGYVGLGALQLQLVCPAGKPARLHGGHHEFHHATAHARLGSDALEPGNGGGWPIHRLVPSILLHLAGRVVRVGQHDCRPGHGIRPDSHAIHLDIRRQHDDRDRAVSSGQRHDRHANADDLRPGRRGLHDPLGLHDAVCPGQLHAPRPAAQQRHHLHRVGLDTRDDLGLPERPTLWAWWRGKFHDHRLPQRILLGLWQRPCGHARRVVHTARVDHARGKRALQRAQRLGFIEPAHAHRSGDRRAADRSDVAAELRVLRQRSRVRPGGCCGGRAGTSHLAAGGVGGCHRGAHEERTSAGLSGLADHIIRGGFP